MDLNPYFDAVDFSGFEKENQNNWKYSLGAIIGKNTLALNEVCLKNVEIAIVGVPFETDDSGYACVQTPDKIRKELYGLAGINKINIVDFGNLKRASSKKGNFLALRDVVDYLNELNITSIIIGGSQDYSCGICEVFRNNPFFSFCSVDALLDVKKGVETSDSTNYLTQIFKNQPDIFQFSLLGFQSYYVPLQYLDKTKGIGFHLRLGILRGNLRLAEPVFRNSDFLSLDFCSLKHSEAPGRAMHPNGLYGEEVCQLARYAGLSGRLKVFGLFGVDSEVDGSQLSISLAAQAIWYFIEGFLNRENTIFEDSDKFSVFKADITELPQPLVFYRNEDTGQWWVQAKALNDEIMFFACSENDYLEAEKGSIPEIWLKYVQKIDELLK